MMRFLPLIIMGSIRGHNAHKHHNNNRLMELLTAGIVAKVLQKQEGDGGGGHEYYPVPIHLPVHSGHGHHHMHASGSHQHHHHVTEKIIPIPVPHHTTRIIHINADTPHGGRGNGEYDQGEGNYGGSNYGDNSETGGHTGSQTKIKQIVFQDSGVYGSPMQAQMVPVRQQAYMAFRRPAMNMVPAAAAHPAYMARPRYPMVAIRQRIPQMPQMAAPYAAASMYAMPYRRVPAPPAPSPYANPMMMRRPYSAPMPMPMSMPMPMPAMW
ncbi:hypothetical protein HNY73_012042 [Argiope bruennichi]|uniref:Uncharacterized protein n=1 Tax=Argiope bruennichi TaxID=94029 RepID=A0A8T0EVQ6_ARGBR|nr:hypothetical protein HNY73_012042 [Argiope bruennichi]